MSAFGSLDERGRTRCPRCYGTKADQLGARLYRCQGECREFGLRPGEREFRIRADVVRARCRAKARTQADRARAERAYTEWLDRVAVRPRTQGMRVFRPSPATRTAWNLVRAAKRHDSFARRAQEFVEAMYRDLHDVPKPVPRDYRHPVKWRRRSDGTPERDYSTTWWGCPQVRVSDRRDVLGLYQRGFEHGHTITIATTAWRNRQVVRLTLDEMRDTLVHEVLHWMDAVAGLDDEHHGRRWGRRLAELRRILPPAERAVPRRRARRPRRAA